MPSTPRASSSSPMISASGAPLLSARRNCALKLPPPRFSSNRSRGRSLRSRSRIRSASAVARAPLTTTYTSGGAADGHAAGAHELPHQPLDAHGKADGGSRVPAELPDQPVVAAAGAYGIL